MAIHFATLEQRSAPSLCTTALKLTPLLFAALLATGCSTKAQRIGSLSGDPSLASTANSKARTTPDATPGGAAAAQGSTQDSKATVETSAAAATAGEKAGDQKLADAGSSSAGTLPSSDDSAATHATSNDGAGGDNASAMTADSETAATSKSGTSKRSGATTKSRPSSRAGSASSSTSTQAAAATPAAAAAGAGAAGAEASTLNGDTTSADSRGAGGDTANAASTSPMGQTEAADLSDGGSVAALEGSAAASANAKKRATTRPGTKSATGTPDDGTGTGGAAADGVESDSRIASIDVPTGKVKVDEEYRPQTLGGVLPLVLGVNEEGRFDFDQYSLRPEVKRILDQLADKLKTAEYDRLDIVGYTDRIGTSDYNRRLSELRAYAVAQYLMSKGVPENKIRYEGRGDKNPVTGAGDCTGLSREQLITCLQNDRRVEIEASIHRKHATVVQ